MSERPTGVVDRRPSYPQWQRVFTIGFRVIVEDE